MRKSLKTWPDNVQQRGFVKNTSFSAVKVAWQTRCQNILTQI